jgi:CheY-like chemotaxis protein
MARKILIVDDDPDVVLFLSTLLQRIMGTTLLKHKMARKA